MFDQIRRDFAHLGRRRRRHSFGFFLEAALVDAGFQAVLLHRTARWLKELRLPILPAAVWRLNQWLTGVDINPNARIGPGLMISHGQGLVVGGDARIGSDCLLHHGVTVGAPDSDRLDAVPKIGDRVVVGAAAQLIGTIVVGDGALVGAGAVVTEDVPAGGRALAPAARVAPPR